MECPICGREVKRLVKAEIEGAIIEVCEDCARKYGRIVSFYEPPKVKLRKKARKEFEEEEVFLVEDFGEKIKRKREELGLTREEFAALIKEKASVIKRIENEEMIPDEHLLKKIEKVLKISLREKATSIKTEEKHYEPLTLGDVAEIK